MVAAVRLTIAGAAALALAGCGQSGSDNVMASSANALTPQQVDLALGPELSNTTVNGLDSSNEVNSSAPANAVEAADEEDALDESATDEPEGEPAAANNGLEQ